MLEGIVKSLNSMQAGLAAMKASIGGRKRTVIVHPQLSRTPAEAAELASDWKAREHRQLVDNIAGR